MTKINKKIRKAREELRRLHEKYSVKMQEVFTDIHLDIDKYLETLEVKE